MSKRRKRRTWSDEEKREIFQQTSSSGVSVAQVARRCALNADMIHTWLKDPRFALTDMEADTDFAAADFVEIVLTASDLRVAVETSGERSSGAVSATRVESSCQTGGAF